MNQQDKDRLRELVEKMPTYYFESHAIEAMKLVLSLLEENESLARDAGRYRWLRDSADYMRVPEGSPQVCLTDEWGEIISLLPSAYPSGATLDSLIDAAMQPKGDNHAQEQS